MLQCANTSCDNTYHLECYKFLVLCKKGVEHFDSSAEDSIVCVKCHYNVFFKKVTAASALTKIVMSHRTKIGPKERITYAIHSNFCSISGQLSGTMRTSMTVLIVRLKWNIVLNYQNKTLFCVASNLGLRMIFWLKFKLRSVSAKQYLILSKTLEKASLNKMVVKMH